MPKLNQILAVEKGAKSRAFGELTKMNNAVQKPALFAGFAKNYRPKDEDGERFPPETQHVQMNARELLDKMSRALSELFDITSTKDHANTFAVADIVVEGETLLEKVPATHILFLEKKVIDIQTFVQNIPTLDPAEKWEFDASADMYRTALSTTARTKKMQKPVVLYDATKEHPAQTQLVSEDVVIGHWDTVKHSGALAPRRREVLLDRIDLVLKALKYAREEANSVAVKEQHSGGKLLRYILKD